MDGGSNPPSSTIKDDQRQWETIGAVLFLPPVIGVRWLRVRTNFARKFARIVGSVLADNAQLDLRLLVILGDEFSVDSEDHLHVHMAKLLGHVPRVVPGCE
jgi:hypothetical protein